MSDVVTYGIELAVGLACLAAAAGLRHSRPLRWLTALLVVGGVAATIHALAGF